MKTRCIHLRLHGKTSMQKKIKIVTLPVLAGFLFVALSATRAESVSQNFSGDALTNGWRVFGDASLFVWDSTNQNLRVTWDSTRTNSYFHHPLGTTVSRHDDFQIEFDLTLTDYVSGNEPGKTGPLPVTIGLFNQADATGAGFSRGNFGAAPNIVEFNYYPFGYYTYGTERFDSPETIVGDFVSSSGFSIAPTIFKPYYEQVFPTNQPVHVLMKYTAKNQALDMILTTNNVGFYHPLPVVLNSGTNSLFTTNDNYLVDTISVSSYSSYNDPFNSLLAHGTVDNLFVNIPPVQDFIGAFSNNVWSAQFRSRTNWIYTLERSTNFLSWVDVSTTVSGNGTNVFLQDANPPATSASYRVRAAQP